MFGWLRRIRRRFSRRPITPEPEQPLIGNEEEETAWALIRGMILGRVVTIATNLGCDMDNVPNFIAAIQIADMLFQIVRHRANELGYERPLWVPVE